MSMRWWNWVTNAASVFDPVWPSDDHTLPGAAEVGGDLFGPLERRIKGPRPTDCHVGSGPRGTPGVIEFQLIRNRHIDALERSQIEGRAEGRAFCARAIVAADVDHECIVELAHVSHGLDDPTDLMVGIGDIGSEHLSLPGEKLLLIRGERVPLR